MGHQTIGVTGAPNREEQSRRKKNRVLGFLNEQLLELGQVGRVVTVLIYNQGRNKISCFGTWIEDGALKARLNASVRATIAYPRFHQLRWPLDNGGDFARLQEFEPRRDDDLWVALINFPINPERSRLRFPTL